MTSSLVFRSAVLLVFTAQAASAAPAQFFPADGTAKPFSAAVRAGDTVYSSGAIGVAADGSLPAAFNEQARNAMQAVADELKRAHASMRDVYKCTVLLTDMRNWAAFNTVYTTFFDPAHLPVRTAAGVNALVKDAAVEVECDAYAPR